jgi:hypothetical protein
MLIRHKVGTYSVGLKGISLGSALFHCWLSLCVIESIKWSLDISCLPYLWVWVTPLLKGGGILKGGLVILGALTPIT